jgi:RNA polymerase sigma factor (sigma-70 family)
MKPMSPRSSSEARASRIEFDLLAARAVTGDGRALSELCRALEGPVFRLCLRMLGDPTDAEDAAQDILVKVVTNLSQFQGQSALTTWVHTIAVRHLWAMKKSRAEERAVDGDTFARMLEQGLAFGATRPDSVEDRAFVDEVRLSCTQGMLMMLGREERLALVLVELLGLEGEEAAAVAGSTHEAFRQRLSRAREKLGGFLRAHCGLVDPERPCRCDLQAPAKQALGAKRRFLPLLERDSAVLDATAELRALRAVEVGSEIAGVFERGGRLVAPATLRTRLQTSLPNLLRD